MNGVPALRPQYPNYGNVLAQGAAIEGQEARNVLNQMQIQDYPEERNWLKKQRGFVEEDRAIAARQTIIAQDAKALDTAFKAKTPQAAIQAFNMLKHESSKAIVDFKMDEKTTSITYGDGTKVEGPISDIIEATAQILKDPSLMTDPEKVRHFAAWSATRGIKFTAAQEDPERLYETEKGLQPREKAIGLMGIKKSPTTAMAAFLKSNPDATSDEIAAFAQKLKKPSAALTFEQRKELKAIGPDKDPTTAIAAFLKNNPDASNEEIAAYKRSLYKPSADKPGVQYMLKDRSRVTSFDGGRTYRNEAGKAVRMPHDADKISTTLTGADLSMYDAQAKAKAELGKDGGGAAQAGDIAETAEGGTGPYAMAAATVDAVLGGLGVDKLFGAKGLFSDTQENRQVLRTIKQLGKAALMNSSRGAIWEQQKIDKLFPDPDKMITNPRTEAKKFKTLRKILAQERHFNLKAITTANTPEAVGDLTEANLQIDRLLSLIGTGTPTGGGPQIGAVEDGYTFKGGDPADPKSWEKVK